MWYWLSGWLWGVSLCTLVCWISKLVTFIQLPKNKHISVQYDCVHSRLVMCILHRNHRHQTFLCFNASGLCWDNSRRLLLMLLLLLSLQWTPLLNYYHYDWVHYLIIINVKEAGPPSSPVALCKGVFRHLTSCVMRGKNEVTSRDETENKNKINHYLQTPLDEIKQTQIFHLRLTIWLQTWNTTTQRRSQSGPQPPVHL